MNVTVWVLASSFLLFTSPLNLYDLFRFLAEVEELKMLRFFNLDRLGRTGLEMSKSEGQAQVEQFADKAREATMRWFGHVERTEDRRKLG